MPHPSDVLHELVRRIDRLRPDHRDPHRFHEEKSEIAYELAQLAGRVG
ncbi:MAG: hypothetical protein ABJ375_13270 [Rhizobiaceae bacterium]